MIFIGFSLDFRLNSVGGPQLKGLEKPLPEWFIAWALRILEPQAVCCGEIVVNAEEPSPARSQAPQGLDIE